MGVRKLNDEYFNVISKNLIKYRKLHNLSQPELCKKLALLGINMFHNDIYRIEHNKKSVKDFELYALAKVLNITVNDLLEGIDEKFNYSD